MADFAVDRVDVKAFDLAELMQHHHPLTHEPATDVPPRGRQNRDAEVAPAVANAARDSDERVHDLPTGNPFYAAAGGSLLRRMNRPLLARRRNRASSSASR